ncbi:MAG: ubiquinol-cytochrome c reductase iron-sulfur subunit [Gammaproteobacteria bacterium]|nr:ubiquinol-cytochrome c reductase iron-sulfur subunit [Gammaproteobacteria bacterium]
MADDENPPIDENRRDFILNTTTSVVAGAGIATACWPFISSMNPSSDVLSKATSEASLKGIEPGEMKTVPWQGKPVFILHRTKKQITSMETSDGGKDPQADAERVQNPDWLVLVGICTHLGCVPARKKEGWFCPCHGSVYDNSGRVLTGPAPRNLELPPYEFVSSEKIIIGKTEKPPIKS